MIDVREHLSQGTSRAGLKLAARRSIRSLWVIAAGALVGLGCWFVVLQNVGQRIYTPTREIAFEVQDASAVVPGRQEVRFKGMPAGTITKVERRDDQPVITVEVYKRFGPIYRNSRAAVRPNTALEDMYLDIIDRGSATAGEATATAPVPARQTTTSVQVEDVLQAFEPDVRLNLATLLDQFGAGLEDQGDSLRAAFVGVAPFVRAADRLTRQLASRSRLTRRLVHNAAVLTRHLGRRERDLRALVSHGARTLETLEHGSADFDATLRELPPTLATIDTSFGAVRDVLPDLDRALVSLRPAADNLPEALSALREISGRARPAVEALRPAVRQLVPLARVLAPFSSNLREATGALRPQMGAFDHVTRTVAGCPTGIQGFFHWTASLMKFGDERGPSVRGEGVVSVRSTGEAQDPNFIVAESCAPGRAIGGIPGTGGDLRPDKGAGDQ